ncbi:unnamed protein product [Peniophora sp. CBMAI 1063]|nr:unnamed protein product [Peniophora sp. CBMAI 1063]
MFKFGLAPPPSRPRTPVPKFKYIDDPISVRRNYAHSQMPFAGDFCVVSIDHVASVAHLGPEARTAAKRIPSERYVAYIGSPHSISYEGNATNPFALSLICRGVPPTSAFCESTPACIPILPNSELYGGRQPLEAVAPFPWPGCYISTFTTTSCRVTTAKRDYSPLLCLPSHRIAAKVYGIIERDNFSRADFYDRRKRGDTEALARMPLSPSPEPSSDPLAFLPPTPAVSRLDGCDDGLLDTEAASATKSLSDLASNTSLHALVASSMFGGDFKNWPVVNIWFDLDMVTDVRDPELFMKECDMLNKLRWHFEDLQTGIAATKPSTEACSTVVGERAGLSGSASAERADEGAVVTSASEARVEVDDEVPDPESPSTATTEAIEDPASPLPSGNSHGKHATALRSPTTKAVTEVQHPVSSDSTPRASSRSPQDISFPTDAEYDVASSTQKRAGPVRTSSLRRTRRSSSRASQRSLKGPLAVSVSPTKSDLPLHPHPYADRPTRSTSTLSYAVPRSCHDASKSLRKSRSSASLKAPRRAETFPVPSSRLARH